MESLFEPPEEVSLVFDETVYLIQPDQLTPGQYIELVVGDTALQIRMLEMDDHDHSMFLDKIDTGLRVALIGIYKDEVRALRNLDVKTITHNDVVMIAASHDLERGHLISSYFKPNP